MYGATNQIKEATMAGGSGRGRHYVPYVQMKRLEEKTPTHEPLVWVLELVEKS